MDESEYFKDPWIIVVADGTRFIGRIATPEKYNCFSTATLKKEVLGLVYGQAVLTLNPCFEYPIFAETTDKGLRKVPLPNSVDMMLDPCDVHLSQISRLIFVCDMSQDDQALVMKFKDELLKILERQRAARRGIEIANRI